MPPLANRVSETVTVIWNHKVSRLARGTVIGGAFQIQLPVHRHVFVSSFLSHRTPLATTSTGDMSNRRGMTLPPCKSYYYG